MTENGPQGNINPNQFPISGVALDSSDSTGKTAYITVMGFTGGAGHVWKTTNAGATWTDFSGNLPDSPANAVVVYSSMSQVYVATDVGVFGSSTASPGWTELGPAPGPGESGFLPNVAVTALGVFASGGQQLLRASTYGRGIWQFNLLVTPDFQLKVSDSPQTTSAGETATFHGTATSLNGYSKTVSMSCAAGVTSPPSTCTVSPASLTPGINTAFTITAGGAAGDYYFNAQGVGGDSNHITHQASTVLHIANNSSDFSLSEPTPFPTVNAGSSSASGQISVTGTSGFSGSITLTCSLVSAAGSCSVTPVTSLPATPTVTVNAPTLSAGSYELIVQGTSGAITHTLIVPFNVGDFQLSGTQSLTVGVGEQGTANLTITASTYYGGTINASCDASSKIAGASCTFNPSPIFVNVGGMVPVTASINLPISTTPGTYTITVTMQDGTGAPSHTLAITLTVTQNFSISSSTASQTVTAGQISAPYNLSLAPVGTAFSNAVSLACSGLPTGAQCTFNPSALITPGNKAASVAMTISTSPTTALGTYSIAVTGTSGSLSHTVIVSLVVSGDFQLAITQPFADSVDAGSSQTAKVSVTSNYSGWINASCDSSSILGAQCSITPANPIAISATSPVMLNIVLNLPNSTPPGPYTVQLTVEDQSTSPSHRQSLNLTVIQDFSVISSTASQTVVAGATTAPYQLTIAPNPQGSLFPNSVALSCSAGLPAGAQCVFSPSTVTPGNSAADVVMSISTPSSSSAGTYSVTVKAMSGLLSHTVPVSLVVTSGNAAPAFQFAVVQAFPATIDAGTIQTAKVSVTPNYSGHINATCVVSSMTGAQCSLTPANPVAISANTAMTLTVSVTVPNDAVPKSYSVNLTVSDSSGQPSSSLQPPLALTVIEDFSVSSATPSQTITAGQTTGAYQLTVAPNPPGSSFGGAVTLSCSPNGLPAGAECRFSPDTPQTPGSSAVNVVMTVATAASAARSQQRPGRGGTLYAIWVLFPALMFAWTALSQSSPKQKQFVVNSAAALLLMLLLPSCSGMSSGGSGGGSGGNPTTYTVTVVGTSGSLSHSTSVKLVVQ